MKYNTNEIYFGNITFNTGHDGFYTSSVETFQKVGEDEYKQLRKNQILSRYHKDTKEYLSVSRLYPLIKCYKGEVPATISDKMLKLQLLKYKLSVENKYKDIDDNRKSKK